MDKETIKKGISGYQREQQALLRLVRKPGGLAASKFDDLFRGREYRKRVKIRPTPGDSFILGMGVNGGTEWAFYLDLLQHMMAIDLIDTIRNEKDEITYVMPTHLTDRANPRGSGRSRVECLVSHRKACK